MIKYHVLFDQDKVVDLSKHMKACWRIQHAQNKMYLCRKNKYGKIAKIYPTELKLLKDNKNMYVFIKIWKK